MTDTPSRPRQVLVYGLTVVEIWDDNHVRTILPGGSVVPASPQDDDAYRATAERLGYGADTARMMREHEALHVALCHWLGLPESPALTAAEAGRGPSLLTGLEEDAVLAIQRFANAAGADLSAALRRASRWGRRHG